LSTIKSKQLEGVKANQLLSNNITAAVDPTNSQDITQGYFPSSVWVNTAASPAKVFVCSDNSIGSAVWNQIAPSASAQTITQTLHGFTVGQVLKHSAGSYSLAQADSQANLGIWLVTKVIDANTFQAVQSGYVTGLSGGTADETWYLSDTTAGGLVNAAPTISQPIIYWITASEGWVLGYPASSSGVIPSGNAPNGYNRLNLTFTGNTVTYEGDIVVQGQSFGLNNSVIVSGAAGWRYGVIDTSGNASHEAIPPAEIVADTQQYTPDPPFDSAWNGYYSSVNPAKRIAWILYFDGTDIIEAIPYGDGHNKNDDFWKSEGVGVAIGIDGYRFQYINPFSRSRGTSISIVDNGIGVTDSEGFRITALKAGRIDVNLEVVIAVTGAGSAAFNINKKGQNFKDQAVLLYNTQAGFPLNFSDTVQPGDYYTFYIDTVSGSVPSYIQNPSVMFTGY
jgi:hypothetical protein